MQVDVTPPLEPNEQRALLAALADAGAVRDEADPYGQAWRLAGLREGAEDEAEVVYAFSPRSTRGATRA